MTTPLWCADLQEGPSRVSLAEVDTHSPPREAWHQQQVLSESPPIVLTLPYAHGNVVLTCVVTACPGIRGILLGEGILAVDNNKNEGAKGQWNGKEGRCLSSIGGKREQ